jgi:hypothetical protein
MPSRKQTVGCYLAKKLFAPDPVVEYWQSSTNQQELLDKPPHEAMFLDGAEQVDACFQLLRPVPDAYRKYLPDASRLAWVPDSEGYMFMVLPVPVMPADANLAAQVQAAVQTAGPVWVTDTDIEQCRKLFPAESGYFLRLQAVPLGGMHQNGQWRWGAGDEKYVEVRYAPDSARRSLHARRNLAKRDAVSVEELRRLIDSLAEEARQAGFLTGYCPTSWHRAGIPALVDSLNSVLAVHRAVCGRWAYRQNREYAAFLRRVWATRKATLRKFRNERFQAWLLQELRSRAAKRAVAEAAGQGGNGCPRRWPDCLPLPFDDAFDKLQTAKD